MNELSLWPIEGITAEQHNCNRAKNSSSTTEQHRANNGSNQEADNIAHTGNQQHDEGNLQWGFELSLWPTSVNQQSDEANRPSLWTECHAANMSERAS